MHTHTHTNMNSQVLIDLLGLPVLPQQVPQNPHTADPQDLDGHAAPSLAGLHVFGRVEVVSVTATVRFPQGVRMEQIGRHAAQLGDDRPGRGARRRASRRGPRGLRRAAGDGALHDRDRPQVLRHGGDGDG